MGVPWCHAAIPLLVLQSGCASWLVRSEGAYSHRADIYPATTIDVGVVSQAVTQPFVPPVDSDAQDGLVYVILSVAIVDLPLAVVADTILLPHDLRESFRRSSRSREAAEETANASP